jgi:indolepyruvate decarboxylase
MTIGAFLARRLAEFGVRVVFGVPGDFNLSFLEQLEEADGIRFVGTCNELNAAYSADGHARLSGVGALLTTFGVGDLGAISGVAGAYAENVPIVHVTGAPPLHVIERGALMHHTLADGDFDNIGRCLSEFTVAQARITPANAAFEIDRVLGMCWLERRPVYLQLPSDVTHVMIDVPEAPFMRPEPASDPRQLRLAVRELAATLTAARRPALLIDAEVERFGVAGRVQQLAERCGVPYAVLPPAKGVLDETSRLYAGRYAGSASAPPVRMLIEQADCLIGIGLRLTDAGTAFFSQRIEPDTLIELRRHDLSIGARQIPGVMLRELLEHLLEAVPPMQRDFPARAPHDAASPYPACLAGDRLTHAALWPRIERFLQAGDVIFGEIGCANAALSAIRLPPGAAYVSQPIWGAIGYTLPALFGALIAASRRRHLLFIGDGSFQVTAQNLSTILRHGLKPIIFLLNNEGYTIERLILGETASYNDVNNWRYAELPRIFDHRESPRVCVAETVGDLETALCHAEVADRLVFIELKLEKLDAPASLEPFCRRNADFVFGGCGPGISV